MSNTSIPQTDQTQPRGFFRYKNKIIIGAAAIILVTIVFLLPKPKPQVMQRDEPPVNVKVMTVTAEPNLADTFVLPAVVEPNRIIMVAAEVAGRIERINPEKGDTLKQGDLILKLNTDLILPELQRAEAQVQRDKIQYERMQELVKTNATSRQDLDDATTDLAISKAALAAIQAQLERTSIHAPCSGVLNELLVEEGEYVQPGTPVVEIVDSNTVKVVVKVPERDTAFFSVGQQAEVTADVKGQTCIQKGTITFINELADAQTRSTSMEITIDNPQRNLRSGQIVYVRLTRQILKDVILIPLLAVIPMEEGKAVYVVNSTQAQRRDVKLGLIKGDRIQITSGLSPGDKLIIAGHRFVAPGQSVNIIEENP
jgi:membrane fusion protein (multidrug efflux system)